MSNFKTIDGKWMRFLKELDQEATDEVRLDCMGGFVVSQFYGFSRETFDLDALVVAPNAQQRALFELGRLGGVLHKKYGFHLEFVGVGKVPEDYESRLTEMFPKSFQFLRLMALDPYDLALSKLERNLQRDRDDVKYLARAAKLDTKIFKERYDNELRWQMGIPEREDLTLKLWLEMIEFERENKN